MIDNTDKIFIPGPNGGFVEFIPNAPGLSRTLEGAGPSTQARTQSLTLGANEAGPGIGKSRYRNFEAFGQAAQAKYQEFYEAAYARAVELEVAGKLRGAPNTRVGAKTDSLARFDIRAWVGSEGIREPSIYFELTEGFMILRLLGYAIQGLMVYWMCISQGTI